MEVINLEVREMSPDEIPHIVSYFIDAKAAFLAGMGADKSKLPSRKVWEDKLLWEHHQPYSHKTYYYLIWVLNNKPIGHSNINNIEFGKQATMHLHIWDSEHRQKGHGHQFVTRTIPFFFENFQLQKLICQPYAENEAPNKTLLKVGFDFIRKYETIPGAINFRQQVCQYELRLDNYHAHFKKNRHLS